MTVATDAEAGRNCPYCRFALKAGVPVIRCATCDAVHHEDCWNDGGGCAIFGCAGAGSTATVAAVPPPRPGTATHAVALDSVPPPSSSPPPVPPEPRASSSTPAVLIAMIAVLLVLIAGAGGYLLTANGGKTESAAADTGAELPELPDAAPPEETATPEATPTPEPTPDPQVRAKRQAERIAKIVAFSLEGRTAVREGRFAEAVSNRRTVLRRLGSIRNATGDVARAKRTLQKAMRASLNADIAYQNGTDASAYDAEATRYKEEFADDWAPVAEEHGLAQYAPGDI